METSRNFERLVAANLAERGYRDILHDVECVYVQVDLLARGPTGLLTIIEVKAETPRGLARVTWAQRARLERVANLLAEYEPVELLVALIDQDLAVTLLPLE